MVETHILFRQSRKKVRHRVAIYRSIRSGKKQSSFIHPLRNGFKCGDKSLLIMVTHYQVFLRSTYNTTSVFSLLRPQTPCRTLFALGQNLLLDQCGVTLQSCVPTILVTIGVPHHITTPRTLVLNQVLLYWNSFNDLRGHEIQGTKPVSSSVLDGTFHDVLKFLKYSTTNLFTVGNSSRIRGSIVKKSRSLHWKFLQVMIKEVLWGFPVTVYRHSPVFVEGR